MDTPQNTRLFYKYAHKETGKIEFHKNEQPESSGLRLIRPPNPQGTAQAPRHTRPAPQAERASPETKTSSGPADEEC